MTIYPIWQTIELNMTSQLSSGKVDFNVYTGSSAVAANLIYSGTAYADADGNCKVRLNDIFKDYLGDAGFYPADGTYASDANAARQFYVTYGSGTATYKIVNDWSYETITRTDQTVGLLNDPVTDWLSGQACWITKTIIGAGTYWYTYYVNGTAVAQGSGSASGKSATLFFNNKGAGQLLLEVAPYGGGTNKTYTYTIGSDCNPMSLTYRNKYGGYDTLQLASCVENQGYSRNTYEIAGSNASHANALLRTPSESVTRTFTLRTPVLTDTQAAKMDNVLGTTQAWLNTLELGTIAVNMVTASWKKKTFKNEGRKRVVYEFEVQFAQPMERR